MRGGGADGGDGIVGADGDDAPRRTATALERVPAAGVVERYADLVVRVGANVGDGQVVLVRSGVELAEPTRAVVRAAYDAGARYVEVQYRDDHVRRAHVDLAPEDALGWSPPWTLELIDHLREHHGALIVLSGHNASDAIAGADERRLARSLSPALAESMDALIDSGRVNWCCAPCPSAEWAQALFGTPDAKRLWDAVGTALRLDEPDPRRAWRTHLQELEDRAATLRERRFDAVRLRGPGTELEIGLMPESLWTGGAAWLSTGREHVTNLPTEEVFTAPHRLRAEGVVTTTGPYASGGAVVERATLRFAGGRVVEARAERGEAWLLEQLASDEGAGRLGEVALVETSSPVGRLGLVFDNVILDENASSHIALGGAYARCVQGSAGMTADELEALGMNRALVAHFDLPVGGPDVDVDGVEPGGAVVPVLRDGAWVLD